MPQWFAAFSCWRNKVVAWRSSLDKGFGDFFFKSNVIYYMLKLADLGDEGRKEEMEPLLGEVLTAVWKSKGTRQNPGSAENRGGVAGGACSWWGQLSWGYLSSSHCHGPMHPWHFGQHIVLCEAHLIPTTTTWSRQRSAGVIVVILKIRKQ